MEVVQFYLSQGKFKMHVNYVIRFCILTLLRLAGGGRGGGQNALTPNSFSPATSTNVGVSPQNFPAFSFNPYLVLILAITSASPKLVNLNQNNPSKKVVFLVKSL